MSIEFEIDMKVDVWFGAGLAPLPGTITKIVPTKEYPIKVVFDDPLVYGGVGAGWFTEEQIALPGFVPEGAS